MKTSSILIKKKKLTSIYTISLKSLLRIHVFFFPSSTQIKVKCSFKAGQVAEEETHSPSVPGCSASAPSNTSDSVYWQEARGGIMVSVMTVHIIAKATGDMSLSEAVHCLYSPVTY